MLKNIPQKVPKIKTLSINKIHTNVNIYILHFTNKYLTITYIFIYTYNFNYT